MKMTDLFLAELEREAAATRRTLERVPDGRYDWKPHEKSMALGLSRRRFWQARRRNFATRRPTAAICCSERAVTIFMTRDAMQ